VHAGRRHRRHLGGHRALSIDRQPINAGANQEVGAELARLAEQLVDIALAITEVHQPVGRAEKSGRLPHVLEPAHALLVVDRHTRGIDVALELAGALEL
jgi:hypothetical protein